MTKTELFGTDKTALFANLPALRTILQLASENQLKQEQWIILTLNAQEEVIQFDNFEDIYAYMADYPMPVSYTHLTLPTTIRCWRVKKTAN